MRQTCQMIYKFVVDFVKQLQAFMHLYDPSGNKSYLQTSFHCCLSRLVIFVISTHTQDTVCGACVNICVKVSDFKKNAKVLRWQA